MDDAEPTVSSLSVTVSRKSGAAAEIKITGYDEADAPHAIDGWAGVTLENQNIPAVGAIKDLRAVVYSNIEEPEKVDFEDVYGDNPTDRQGNAARSIWNRDTTAPGAGYSSENRSLTLTGGAISVGTSRIKADDDDHFPPKGQTFSYGSTDDDDARRVIPGTFHGADGEYRCIAETSCTVTVNANGHYTFTATGGANAEWVFIHNNGAQAEVADVDHLTFGYWISTPMDANTDGTYTYEVDLIAGGSLLFLDEDAPATGSATYKGDAAGVYAVKTGPAGQAQLTSWGEFIADASLTAKWGSLGETDKSGATLQGQITNFQSADGKNINMDGWRVDLREDDLASSDGMEVASTDNASNASALMGAGNASSRATWTANFRLPDLMTYAFAGGFGHPR